eukprot:Hpha_TRINITY_DN16825_c2_g5::TRINITY_DN16825_c2_g5_i2::g.148954::m.148954/K03514/PAPD5_7, TRF4; non-canonical poly(A) RNA polymerase PAPD5/7
MTVTSMARRGVQQGRQPQNKVVDVNTVTTPWFPDGVHRGHVTLEAEVTAVAQLLQLSPGERLIREEAVRQVITAARLQWGPQVTAVPYGSFQVGLSAPTSAVDLAIGHCTDNTPHHLRALAARIPGAEVLGVMQGFAQLRLRGGAVSVNLVAHEGAPEQELRSVMAVREMLRDHPQVAPAHIVLRQILQQSGTLDVTTGGMSAYALLIALVRVVRRRIACHSASALIVAFCLDHSTQAGAAGNLVAPDPLDESRDLAEGCTRGFAIRSLLQHCSQSFQRWEARDDTAAAAAKECETGVAYRGRTVFSSLLSHQTLWPRRDALRREQRQQQRRSSAVSRRIAERTLHGDTQGTTVPVLSPAPSVCGLSESPRSGGADIKLVPSAMSLETMASTSPTPDRGTGISSRRFSRGMGVDEDTEDPPQLLDDAEEE